MAFASRSLSRAEENYSQIDKEALALVWGIKHFHQYLWGVSIRVRNHGYAFCAGHVFISLH